jgi:general nucleoside transport system ATP-binding protein
MDISSGTHRPVSAQVPHLALHGIVRRYGALVALDNATFSVERGEVHALLGENGAGKSTLMKIAFGLERPSAGTVLVKGHRVAFRSPADAMRAGIGMVQQHYALVDAMTVAENVALGGTGRLDLDATSETIRRIGVESGLILDPGARIGSLSVGAQQRVEIVKALSRGSHTLILDEPTAVLAPAETQDLLHWVRRFAASGGTVVLIAHKLSEVLSVADRVTVLRRGRTVLTARAGDTSETMLAEAMLGARAATTDDGRRVTRRSPTESVVLSVNGVAARDAQGIERLKSATISVRGGEILGVAAVEGAGQRELLRVLAGRLLPSRGAAVLPANIGFVPEDRQRDALVMDVTLTENFALRDAGIRRGLIPWSMLTSETTTLLSDSHVLAESADVPARALSGGNQQKFVIARELNAKPSALVAENPTRGLDIRATEDVRAALLAARDAGMAVVVYSSDLDEVLTLADRVVVLVAGRLREVASDAESVGLAMLAADV